jgi:hypothetical protein
MAIVDPNSSSEEELEILDVPNKSVEKHDSQNK